MSSFGRQLYGLLLRMHPTAFRNEFGREMMLDFDDARQSHGLMALYWDAVVSLMRQWTTGGLSAQVEGGTMPKPSLLSGQYVMICQDEMTAMEFMRGLVLSVTFLTLCGFAEAHVTTTGAIPLAVNHMGPSSPQQGNSSAVGRAGGDNVAVAAGGGDRQPIDKVAMDLVRVNDSAKEAAPRTSERVDRGAGSNGKVSLLAAAVSPKMNTAPNDGQTGGSQAACGSAPTAPMRDQILHASGPVPSFEVVSIRPWRPNPSPPPPPSGGTTAPRQAMWAPLGGGGAVKTDRIRMILPAKLLIVSAYGLPMGFENHIVGGADWLISDQYEIQAKIEGSRYAAMQKMTPAQQREQLDLMEQALLADRFKLKVHFETREMPVYAPVVAKGGAKLTPAKECESKELFLIHVDQALQMTAAAVTLDEWLHSPFMGGRMVEDQTGLKGAYDFKLTWVRDQPVVSDAGQQGGTDAPVLFTAIQEQLGLKLVPTKGPVEVIVIDHIERPSAN